MQPHKVTITYNTWGTDIDGGRMVTSSRILAQVPCFVQPGKARTIVDTSDERGFRRVTEIVPTRVFFVSNVSVNIHDLIQWVDGMNVKHNYAVIGFIEPGGLNSFWRADCQETI